MHAMILDDKLNFVWAEVPDPVRKEGEVLIQVHAAAVNRADLMQKDGCYASPPDWPQWCGLEVSGEVLEAPADAAVKPGDKVALHQDVVVLEAMKMENNIPSDYAGTVKRLLVKEGENVPVDAPLVELE